jgi:hypothetical protein
MAMRFRKDALAPSVRLANTGTSEIGSTTRKKTTKNFKKDSITMSSILG